MKKLLLLVLMGMLATSSFGQAIVWVAAGESGDWDVDANWDSGFYPSFPGDEVVFNGASSANCIVNGAQTAGLLTTGNGDADYEGKLIITAGSSLKTTSTRWAAIGWTRKTTLIVEAGALLQTRSHLWLAFNPGAKSFIELHGTIDVGGYEDPNATPPITASGGMFGVNFEGKANADSEAKLRIHNGGHLKLSQLTGSGASPNNSFNGTIADGSVEILAGGKITLPEDRTGDFNAYISAGKIITPGGNAVVAYDAIENLTTVTSDAPLSTESFNSLNFEAYPNPSSDVVYISSKSTITKVTVRNILGQSVLQTKNTATLNIANLQSGIYLVSVEDETGNTGTKKIIKK